MDIKTLKVVAEALKNSLATFESQGDETSQMAVKLTTMAVAGAIHEHDQSLHPLHFMDLAGLPNRESLEFMTIMSPDWWTRMPLNKNRFE